MAKRKTMRASRPARASAKAEPDPFYFPAEPEKPRALGALGVSRRQWWKALRVSLPPRGDGSAARAKYRQFFLDHEYAGGRGLAEKLHISFARLMRGTRGAAFRQDFGVDSKGRQVAVFFEEPMLEWALGGDRALTRWAHETFARKQLLTVAA